MGSAKIEQLYGHSCDYCSRGRVRCEIRARELIRVTKTEFVALEQVPIGVCDRCKARYYHASVLRQAEAIRRKKPGRTVKVRVARFVAVG